MLRVGGVGAEKGRNRGQELSLEGGGGAAQQSGAAPNSSAAAAAGLKGGSAYLGAWFGGGGGASPNANLAETAPAPGSKAARASIYVQNLGRGNTLRINVGQV